MTYPDAAVIKALNENFVPVQLDVSKESKRLDQYQVIWTPNINVVDHRERVFFHLEGWLPPAEFAAMLHCGRGHYDLHTKRFEQAVNSFQRVFDDFPQSEFAPEALYYAAVGKYLSSHEADRLMEGWDRLQRRYPTSAWAHRTRV
ncbi:MAG TPA: hypothetical protein VLT88_08025 [Desulfosarcina sp.]|nr:hypothetical protein [Desulfosarcina sp.]